MSASEYLDMFRAGQSDIPNLLEESIYDPSRDYESSNSVFQTWRLSFEQLTMQSPKAAGILSLMAVLDRQAISSNLIRAPRDNMLDQKAAIAKLKAFSLIQEESSSDKFSIHRLVQLSTQRWLADHGMLSQWQKAAIGAVARELPMDVDFDQWTIIQDLNSHVYAVLAYDFSEPTPLVEKARILHCFGHYAMEKGQVKAALRMLLESHRLQEEQLGSEDELTLETLGMVGLAHSKLHQRKSAREVLERFHDSTHRVLGPRHRLTLKGKSRLAVCYNKEGKRREGKDLFLQTLQLVEEEFGPDDEDTIRVLTNLVYCCNKLRHWEEAEGIGLRVLKQRIEQRGPDHPDTLTIMGSLAWTYRGQSRFQEAKELHRKALSRRREILGPDHPKTLSTIGNLAEVCGLLDDWEGARKLQREVVESNHRTFGAQHDNTKRVEKYLKITEAVLRDKSNEIMAKAWLTRGYKGVTEGRGRGPTKMSGGKHRYNNKRIAHSYQDSTVRSRSDSIASMPPFMSTDLMTPAASPGTRKISRTASQTNPDFEDARNEVTRTLQAVKEAQGQLLRANQDLAERIQEFARGNTAIRCADLGFLRQDHRDLVYANLERARTEHEEARKRTRSLGKGPIHEATGAALDARSDSSALSSAAM